MASKVMEGFPGALKDGVWCGNPVREEIAALPSPEKRFAQRSGAMRLLVVGGSRGALAINELIPQALALLDSSERPVVLHQTGNAHLEKTREMYQSAGVNAEVVPFIDKMEDAYRWADFAVCRAGALTIAELTAAGLGSLLIPFPYAIDDHQTHNGELLVTQGAALMYQQSELSAQALADQIKAFNEDPKRRLEMAQRARGLAKTDAAGEVARVCLEVARDR